MTVFWLMKSFSATSEVEQPSAMSWSTSSSRLVTHQISGGTGTQRRGHDILVGVHGQHDDARVGQQVADAARCLDSIDVGHRHIHEDDVGLQLGGEAHRLFAVGRFAHYLEALVGHRSPQTLAEHPMIVGEHESNCHSCYLR